MNSYFLSRYLVEATAPRLRLRHYVRMAIWQRPRFKLRTTRHLIVWLAVLTGAATIGNPYVAGERAVPAPIVADVAAAAPSDVTVPAVTRLPGGPDGHQMPPGSLSPMGTYRNGYASGNCTWYVASRRPVPTNWGNARTWLPRAQAAGWSVGTAPAVGAIAWTSKGSLGHVAVVEAVEGSMVTIAEMNFTGYNRVSHRTVPATSFQYIY